MSIQLSHYLILSGILFAIGAAGFLFRRNALVALMSIELMLNSVNLTLVAFNRWQPTVQVPAIQTRAGYRAAENARAEAAREDEAAAQAARRRDDRQAQEHRAAAQTARARAEAVRELRVPMIPHQGQIFAFFVIAVAAAEAALGLAIVLALYRVRKTVRTDDADLLKG